MRYLLSIVLLATIIFTSCRKEEENTIQPVYENTAAELPDNFGGTYRMDKSLYRYTVSPTATEVYEDTVVDVTISRMSEKRFRLQMQLSLIVVDEVFEVTDATRFNATGDVRMNAKSMSNNKTTSSIEYTTDPANGNITIRNIVYHKNVDATNYVYANLGRS